MTASEAAKEAAKSAERQAEVSTVEPWPVDEHGEPMVKISMQSQELLGSGHEGIPDYSSITIGPAKIEAFVSKSSRNPFSDAELKNVASALNQLSEVVESDVVAEQRQLALDGLSPR